MPRIGGQIVPSRTVLLISTEAGLIVLTMVAAMLLRFRAGEAVQQVLTFQGIARLSIVVIVCELSMYYHDLYELQMVRRRATLFVQLVQAFGVALLLLGLVYYIFPELSLGRGVALLAAPSVLALICGSRMILQRLALPKHRQRVLIMGTGEQGIALAREIISRPEFNLAVVGFLDEHGENIGKSLVNPRIIGGTRDVQTVAEREHADRIVLALKDRRGSTPVEELLHLRFGGIVVEDAHTLFESLTGRILLDHISPSTLILSSGFRESRSSKVLKRLLDISLCGPLLALLLPAMATIASAIWLEDGDPFLFRQQRIGRSGHPFQILKFRSMYECQNAQPSWTADGDKRITRVGSFIRKYRLDELPQLWNVLRGDMSLVGPRPEQPYFCELLCEQIPFFGLRHTVRPGITGWAQIKYPYGASIEDARRKLELDLFYIKHRSLSLDLAILFETVKVVLVGRGAK